MNDSTLCADAISSDAAPAAVPPPPQPAAGRGLAVLPLFLLLPFIAIYWFCPFFSTLTLGNDYPLYSIGAQMQLLFSIKLGAYPLYFPLTGQGFSASVLTLGQLYHPLTWIAGALPGYWSGHALDLCTLLRLLSLGLVHFALFRFLLRLRLAAAWALLLSFTAVYNLRMLDSMRYGASLENYTGYLLLFIAAGRHYLRPAPPWSFCWIALSTYLLVTGGHPQFMYFGFWGAAVFIPLLPFYCALFLPEARPTLDRAVRFYASTGAAMAAGCVLASAYLLPYYFDFLRHESGRVALDYAWSTLHQDTALGALNSFFNPFFGDVHGSFGGPSVMLLALCLPLLALAGIRTPRVIDLLWIFLVLTLAFQTGSATPLHYWVWRLVPFASSFRVPGRIAFLNPLTITMLLAWLFSLRRRRLLGVAMAPYALLALAGAFLFIAYNRWPAAWTLTRLNFSPALLFAWPSQGALNRIPGLAFALADTLALLTLLTLAACGGLRRSPLLLLLLGVCVLGHAVVLMRYGSWKERRVATPTFAEMMARRRSQVGCTEEFARQGEPMRAVKEYESLFGERDTRLAVLYPEVVHAHDWDEAVEAVSDDPNLTSAVVEDGSWPAAPPTDDADMNRITLAYSSFNRLVFNLDCRRAAFLSLGYPYVEGRWRATVDGRSEPIYRANCLNMGIYVPPGKSVVEFRYFSKAALIGLGVSFLTAYLILCAMLSTLKRPVLRFALTLLAVCFFAGFFLWICHSFYGGKSLGTVYSAEFVANLE